MKQSLLELICEKKNQGTKSCGCLAAQMAADRGKKRRNNDFWLIEMNNFNAQSAKSRKLDFLLTKEQYKSFALDVCFYCGKQPSTICRSAGLRELSILKNGIDRIDSNVGYIYDNCVTCCLQCNIAKMDYSYEEFLQNTKDRFYFLVSKGKIQLEQNMK